MHMSSLPPDVADRLAKLLRMVLSTDHDGERSAAAAAIVRLLKSNGSDLHAFVELLVTAPAAAEADPSTAAPIWQRTTGPVDIARDQLLELIDIIEAASPFLTGKSEEFLASLRERVRYRPKVHLSELQWAWMQDLMTRCGA
jgi:hypothetical protein